MHTKHVSIEPPDAAQLDGLSALRQIQAQARYLFRADEFAKLTGRAMAGSALKSALSRYSELGLIASVAKRPSTWLIVPPEHQHYGAPPVDWWLDDYLRTTEPHYYLALLSAARHWGSAHYALQATQVMVGHPRRPQTIRRLRLDFTFKKDLAQTPVVDVTSSVARIRVSTREATLLDLLRHQAQIGGIEAVARIAKDFGPALDARELVLALTALNQVPAAQRLGFVLEHLKQKKLANQVEMWLQARRRIRRSLDTGVEPGTSSTAHSSRWDIDFTPQQQNSLEELA